MAQKTPANNNRLFLATNTNNLRMILAQGLIAGRSGFSKYYQDLLELHDGWIPLLKTPIQPDIFNYVTQEAEHLVACLIDVDLSVLHKQTRIMALKSQQLIEMTLDQIDEAVNTVLFVPAPLPFSAISKVLFASRQEQENFERDCHARRNVILEGIKLQSTKADQKLFSVILNTEKKPQQNIAELPLEDTVQAQPSQTGLGDDHLAWLENLPLADLKQIDYAKTYAWGGLLAMLFYHAKNGALSHDVFKTILSFEPVLEELAQHDLAIFSRFFQSEDTVELNSKHKVQRQLVIAALNSVAFEETVLELLENNTWEETRQALRAKQLLQTLKAFLDIANDKKTSDYFKQARSSLEKSLLMLFHRQHCDELIEVSSHHAALFSEEELLEFALLFGIRDKFSGLPPFLRQYKGLQHYISLKMVEYAQRSVDSHPVSAETLKPPPTIWELVNKSKTSKKKIIKQLGLEACITTVMPKKDFRCQSGRCHYQGMIEPDYRIEKDKYHQALSRQIITDQDYNKLV